MEVLLSHEANPVWEKLGAFYIGRRHDLDSGETTDEPVLYDAKDLTTHAFCVGMTGSGKTGLCVGLLEEAALDGVPALVIDPKGDLGNLLLTFPDLAAADFEPWVDPDAARRKGLELPAYAKAQAELWKNGLAGWGQDGERIRRLRQAADFSIYTPGSRAGLPISVVSSFSAPAAAADDPDLMRDRVGSTSASLLGLLGIDADPIKSREHILISTILQNAWSRGESLDLPGLIRAIQSPGFERVGVMELESFFDADKRFALAMQLNNLLAAPGFAAWMEGEPLDIQRLLYAADGRPRVAILSIAHLSDAERMFFVAMLLNEVVSWMRSRPGTSSLRAIVYMDEIAGYLPPVANPPSKQPMLTLLKQARAFGVGCVLATQNPVDLDYKGLSNTGTWFLGRLQTERDQKRVMDGLESLGAQAAGFDRARLEKILSGLGKRVFLMHNVHEREPVVFNTRWVMSYLRGPLTRDQIRGLMEGRQAKSEAAAAPGVAATIPASKRAASRPVLRPTVPQAFVELDPDSEVESVEYRPALVGLARVQFVDRKSKRTVQVDEPALLHPLDASIDEVDWTDARDCGLCREDLDDDPPAEASGYGELGAGAEDSRSYRSWKKELADLLYREHTLELFESPSTGLVSKPGESERDFRARVADGSREQRDEAVEKLRARYAKRLQRSLDKIHTAEQRVEREAEQASQQKLRTAISLGTTVLGALFGRKKLSTGTVGRAGTTLRGATRASKEKQDVARAQETLERLKAQHAELEQELEREIDELESARDAATEKLETVALRPRRSDVEVKLVTLAWLPFDDRGDYVGSGLAFQHR